MDRATLINHISQLSGQLIVGVEYSHYDYDTEQDVFRLQLDSGATVVVFDPVICGEAKHNPLPNNVVEFPTKLRKTAEK